MELKPRKHADIEVIIEKAEQGDAFFVNRAALNGDLSNLSEMKQRKIVSIANDNAANYAYDQIIPQTEDALNQNNNFIEKHLNLATKIFFKAGGKSINEIIFDSTKQPLASDNNSG